MASFKLYNCDFGIKVDGTNYDFEHVNELQIEDPERNRITRGGNGKNKTGIAFKDGLRDPKRWILPILQMSAELKEVLDAAFDAQTRVDAYCIDRVTGSQKWARNAVLSNRPQQLTLDDTADSLAVSLEFETFESSEIHKDA